MTLLDQMHTAVDDADIDIDRLVVEARTRGRLIRRRRRAAGMAGTAVAATTVIAAAVVGVGPVRDFGGDRTGPAASPNTAGRGATSPITGRGTVVALRAAIRELAEGRFAAYAGHGDPGSDTDRGAYGELNFSPVDGSGAGVVGVNVQDGHLLDADGFECRDLMVGCLVERLPSGDRLRTYSEVTRTPSGDAIQVVAERLTADRGLRVVASATNGYELPAGRWELTRPDTVLTTEQLTAVVTQPWWGFEIPAE
ncbi:MAG: hypothetical protein ACRCYQ_13000, partial [Nocardioides sp.]